MARIPAAAQQAVANRRMTQTAINEPAAAGETLGPELIVDPDISESVGTDWRVLTGSGFTITPNSPGNILYNGTGAFPSIAQGDMTGTPLAGNYRLTIGEFVQTAGSPAVFTFGGRASGITLAPGTNTYDFSIAADGFNAFVAFAIANAADEWQVVGNISVKQIL